MKWRRRNAESSDAEGIARQAALWLARRDNGLTPAEQDEYIQWLTADPRHAEALAQHAAAFERMMQLYEWQPGQSTEPNPDLFEPRRAPRWRIFGLALAAAVTLAIGGALWWHETETELPVALKSHLRVNERRALADGSVVELKDGTRLTVEFTGNERRVRLAGEAHFTIAKSPVPFVVVAGEVAVRAVGTSFNVRLDPDNVEVLVTSGAVTVDRIAAATGFAPVAEQPAGIEPAPSASMVVKGQRAVVPLAPDAAPQISAISSEEIKETLAWQTPRLQFYETPLGQAVEEFNRHSRVRLIVSTRELAAATVGGAFRVDNPEAFVRALDLTMGIKAEARGANEIVLFREP